MQVDFSQNHFEIFGLEPGFEVDTAALAETYRELQRVVHPDRFASGTEQEKRLAVQRTAQVNEAFQTLKQPLERARYLLQLNGIDINSETDTTVDTEFLMEQMELRERLAEIKNENDPEAALFDLSQTITRKHKAIVDALGKDFADINADSLASARENVRKLQFLNKLQQEADQLDEELADLA
ncbi:MAG: co-chaperone HscB [Gammaproteobacteria bacterium]|nr:co-chaperone HscB [Gammaproteobacteria bacterium]